MKSEEVWVSIPEYPNYQISNKGRVYSTPRKGSKGGLLTIYHNSQKYPCVKLTKDNKCKTWGLHRLLAMCFIPNPDNKPHVLHRDDNKDDYTLENLYWGDASENSYDKWNNNKRVRQTYSFYTDTGEYVTTNNLPLWCEERELPMTRVATSINRGKPVNTKPGRYDRWGNKK